MLINLKNCQMVNFTGKKIKQKPKRLSLFINLINF
jgi:hypothetical protein